MPEKNFLSSWLRDDTESKAEEMENMDKEAKEEASKRGKRELEGEREKVSVVGQRIRSYLPSCMSERFLEKSLVVSGGFVG